MAIILERPLPKSDYRRQFSSCCGASDKGVESGVVCRKCWNPVVDYVEEDNLDYFLQYLNPELKDRFDEFMADDSQDFLEYHEKMIKRR
tara:strand:+ start:143 stop:409 length:267 start_codon:yes stop_codon:yes gene_type:complete